MEAATELATAHSITLRLAPPLLASLALSTCSASIGRFHFQRFRVFRCLMFLLHGVRTSVRARSATYPAGYWIRDIIIYTPTKSTLIHTTSTTVDDLVSVQHLRHRRLRPRKATCRFMHALFTFCAFPPACSCDLFTLSVERAWSCAGPILESGRPLCSLRDQSHCAEPLPTQIRQAGRGPTEPSGRRQTTRSWPSTR
jgi:hypothetical protein